MWSPLVVVILSPAWLLSVEVLWKPGSSPVVMDCYVADLKLYSSLYSVEVSNEIRNTMQLCVQHYIREILWRVSACVDLLIYVWIIIFCGILHLLHQIHTSEMKDNFIPFRLSSDCIQDCLPINSLLALQPSLYTTPSSGNFPQYFSQYSVHSLDVLEYSMLFLEQILQIVQI